MAGVEQLAGLVARLEAVAVKLESSGGAGGAGGDAGASVQVLSLVPTRSYPITPPHKMLLAHNSSKISYQSLFKRSLMTSVVRASNSLPIFATRLGAMWQQLAKC